MELDGRGGEDDFEHAQESLWYRVPCWLISVSLRKIWGLKIVGLEAVPRNGPLIVAGNHVSLLDGALMSVAVSPIRRIHHLGKKELFSIPLLGAYLKRVGMIPLERKGDVGAMKVAVSVLRNGGCIGLFPEGTRSKDGLPRPPKAGIGFLAGHSGALVVPALVVGTRHFPRFGTLEIRFGPALQFSGDPADRGQCMNFAQEVMKRIFALES
jgi:1-acyl-sn-glycerol-3-phosphate acyltransferase